MNTHPSLRRVAVSLAAAASVALVPLLPVVPASPGHAVEVTARPASGTIAVAGHGYGHGRGMSQWGAYGAATKGLSYAQILDFYYPGTKRTAIGDDTIRVALSDADGDTTVAPASGLRVATASGAVTLPTGSGYTAWRATGAGPVKIAYKDAAGAWKPYTPTGLTLGNEVTFATGSGVVTVLLPSGVAEDVRGEVHATVVSGAVHSVLFTGMETYLRGVVPNEMPASWGGQALGAQSVAARTYAAAYRQRQRAAGSWYDICDTTACQVYSGAAQTPSGGSRGAREDARSDAAIAATAGVVLTYNGALINAEFSASNGGYTVAAAQPYFVAKADPYDGVVANAGNTWTASVDASRLDNARGIGRFRRLVVLSRDGRGEYGGRVLTARLEGDAGTANVTGEELRGILGIRSSWFQTASSPDVRDYDSDGNADILAREANGDLRLFSGTGSGTAPAFSAGRVVGTGWGAMVDLFAARDFDGDGRPDIIARRQDGRLFFYGGDGEGGWANQYEIGHGWSLYRSFVSPGDWNGDGRPDVLAINTTTNQLLVSTGAGTHLNDPVAIGTGWGGIVRLVTPGDFDGDGQVDVIGITTTGDMWLYQGTGSGTIKGQLKIGHGWSAMKAVWSPGDVNGDGFADVLAIDGSGTLWLYSGDGHGSFPSVANLGGGWTGRTPVV